MLAVPYLDVAGMLDAVRQNIDRADAMVCATEHQLEQFTWGEVNDDDGYDRRLEHLSHLLGATKEAVRAAVYASGELAAELVKHRQGT
jgi:hypothetical protein